MSNEGASRRIGSTLGRFKLLRCIGAGGMGVVYEAESLERPERVALKTLNHLNADAIYRFKHEFRSLAGVLHPNLVQMHELSCDGPNWFFVMDYVDGVPFIEYVRGARTLSESRLASTIDVRGRYDRRPSDAPESVSDSSSGAPALPERTPNPPAFYVRLRRALGELVSGVNALHALGKIHRDLKPSNVLVTAEGRVVVLDFGLTSEEVPEDVSSTRDGALRGTPLYMAPEMFTGGGVGKAADFYAVGVMLYEALVGELPHRGAVHQLVSQKLFTRPVSPRELVPETPEDLSEIALSLLAREPEQRPLGRELARLFAADVPSRRPPESEARAVRAPFVGRVAELSALRAAFERVKDGPVVVNVSGESGIGKSELVEAFLRGVRDEPEVLVLYGRCYEHESVPYKAFDHIADALSSYLTQKKDGDVSLLAPREPATLTTLFPVLARVFDQLPEAERRVPLDPTELRLRGFSALRELLGRLAQKKRLVLVVDDLQWSDDDSALLLKEVFGASNAPQCLLVVTSRESRPPALHKLLSAWQGSARSRFEELRLSGLSHGEMQELARHASSSKRAGELPISAIAEEAKGNPFFVLALSRHAADSVPKSTSLKSFMAGWFQALPATALELLRVIAVAGRPVDEAAASAVVGGADPAGDLFYLSAHHLIGAWPTPSRRVECYHDRIREAVLADLDAATLRALHGRLGRALEAGEGAEPDALATHFLAAGELEKGSRFAERAADDARRALAFLHAAHWYERAIESSGGDRGRARELEAKLGEVYAGAGQGVTASEWLLRAATDGPSAHALKLRQRAAELLLVSGHIDRGVAELDQVLKHVRMRLAPSPRRAFASLVVQRARAKFRGLEFERRSGDALSEDELLKIDVCWSVALGLSLVDPIRAADFQTRNLLLSLTSGEPYRVARALSMEAGFRATGGSRSEQEAREISNRARALAEEIGDPHAIGLSTFTAGLGRYLVGRWRAAVDLLRRAEGILRELPGAIWELNASQRFQLNALTFIGDIPTIATRVPELVKSARERGNLYAECALRVRLCSLLWLARDDPHGGIAETAEVMGRWSQEGFHLQHYNELFAHVNCALYLGDAERAMQHIESTWPKLESSLLTNTQALRIEARQLRLRVCLAYLRAHPEHRATRSTLERDLRALRKENVAWGTAYASFGEGLLHAVNGEQERARTLLETARREFTECDMDLWRYVASHRIGELIGGDEGSGLIAEAERFLSLHAVKHPLRFVQHYAPGLGDLGGNE
jgi:hypothetical protein